MRRKSPRLGRRGRTYALLCTTTHSEATARGSALRSSGLIPGEVPAVMSDHRQGIKIELLRADVAFWKSPETSDAHLATMRQAFEGVAMVLFAAGILTENLLRNEIPQLVWDSAIAAGWWRCASETLQNIFPERVGHYWVWRDDRTDWHRLFHDETEEWVVRLPVISAKAALAPNLGARLNAACDAVMISHQQQAARIGIGR